MRRSYLKEHCPVFYSTLILDGTLFKHLAEIDQACNERMDIITSAMAKQEGVTEALKETDQMKWVSVKIASTTGQKKLYWLNVYMIRKLPVIGCMADNGH